MHGKPADTPVILIQWGTFSRQKTLEGTLADIAEKARVENFTNPAITLVGDIVSLRSKLNWFEKKPLFGKQILLARTGTSASRLAMELTEQGADVIEFPKWKKIRVLADMQVIRSVSEYEQILFTSPDSVDDFFGTLFNEGVDIRKVKANLFGSSVKSIRALNGKGLFAELEESMPRSGKLLIVGDSECTIFYEDAEKFLTSKMVVDEQYTAIFNRMMEEASINTVILPSSRAAKKLVAEGLLKERVPQQLLNTAEVVCMGERTARIADSLGIHVDTVVKAPANEAVIEHLAKKEQELLA